jgi:PncC family amidohydrolase
MSAGELAGAVGALLRARRLTLAVAESCTGGGLGDALTDIAGSSEYFLGGVIAYANEVKERLLGVPAALIDRQGAVSAEVAESMAEGVRRLVQSDLALAVTGIAGPGGGSEGKPVGLVYIALATPQGARVQRHVWSSDRVGNKRSSVRAALELLGEYLRGA